MSSSLFSPRSLARYLYPQDAFAYNIDLKNQRQRIFDNASRKIIARDIDFGAMNRTTIGSRIYVSYKDYATTLVLRSLAGHVRRRHNVVLSTRDGIVRRVIQALMDATPMSITRRDIRSFYESVPTTTIRASITNDSANDEIVRAYFNDFFSVHCGASSVGLPRGIGLTSILVELILKDFDAQIRKIPEVYRYFRFSDDILIIATHRDAHFNRYIEQKLPKGLVFSREKSEDVELLIPTKGVNEKKYFSFLGYECIYPRGARLG